MKILGWEFHQLAFGLDLSRNGIRIQTTPPLEEGWVVYLLSSDGTLQPRYCRVVWARAGRPEQQCEAGLEFLPHLPA